MPKIVNEYIEEGTCSHHFEVDCCDPGYVTVIGYFVDWHETESQSPDDLLKRYQCPRCKARLTEEQILAKLKPHKIEVRVWSEHYNKALQMMPTSGVKNCTYS